MLENMIGRQVFLILLLWKKLKVLQYDLSSAISLHLVHRQPHTWPKDQLSCGAQICKGENWHKPDSLSRKSAFFVSNVKSNGQKMNLWSLYRLENPLPWSATTIYLRTSFIASSGTRTIWSSTGDYSPLWYLWSLGIYNLSWSSWWQLQQYVMNNRLPMMGKEDQDKKMRD